MSRAATCLHRAGPTGARNRRCRSSRIRTVDVALHLAIGRLSAGWQATPGTRRYRRGSAQTGAATDTAVSQAAALEQERDPGPVTAIRQHRQRSTASTRRSKRPANTPPWRPQRRRGPCPAPDRRARCTGNLCCRHRLDGTEAECAHDHVRPQRAPVPEPVIRAAVLAPRQFICGEEDGAGHGPHQLPGCPLRPTAVWRLTHPPSTLERAMPGKRGADPSRLISVLAQKRSAGLAAAPRRRITRLRRSVSLPAGTSARLASGLT